MVERVQSIDIGVVWDPNAPHAVMLSTDDADTVLALNPRYDDDNSRAVILRWARPKYSSMGAPNDEAVAGHRLFARGLDEVDWIGEVQDSELIASIIREAGVHPSFSPDSLTGLVHHVVLTKEAVVEVVAHSMSVSRVSGETLDAAVTALRG